MVSRERGNDNTERFSLFGIISGVIATGDLITYGRFSSIHRYIFLAQSSGYEGLNDLGYRFALSAYPYITKGSIDAAGPMSRGLYVDLDNLRLGVNHNLNISSTPEVRHPVITAAEAFSKKLVAARERFMDNLGTHYDTLQEHKHWLEVLSSAYYLGLDKRRDEDVVYDTARMLNATSEYVKMVIESCPDLTPES